MKYHELKESLYLCPRHICCEEARVGLYPPRKGTYDFVQTDIGFVQIEAIPYWHIDNGDGGAIHKNVQFCPWCGIRLDAAEMEVR